MTIIKNEWSEIQVEDSLKFDINNTKEIIGDCKMWAVSGDAYFPCEKTEKKLKAGQYIVQFSEHKGYYFLKKTINLDDLIVLPDSRSERVLNSIQNFWTREKMFRKHGFLWKRGIMLYGPPGSGKTSTLQQLSKMIVDRGGFSVYVNGDPEHVAHGLTIMRKIEPDRPIVVMIEDIDAVINRHGEASLLALLDGELQIDNVVFIACLDPNERILTRDLRWIPAGEIKADDEIWSLDEHHPEGKEKREKARRYRKGKVISSFRAKKECVSVIFESGRKIICTIDHPWLATNTPSHTREWVMAKDLMKFPYVLRSFEPWTTETSYEAGWFAGMLDGEGHVTWGRMMAKGIGICQKIGDTLDKLLSIASKFGLNYKVTYHHKNHPRWKEIGRIRFNGTMQEQAALIGSVRAERLIENFDIENGVVSGEYEKVVSVEYLGIREVQSIETDTHTYFGEGFPMHNTTNYPEELDQRFVNRPSRFDEVILIGMPSDKARELYLLKKLPRLSSDKVELSKWVTATDGWSIAHMRELIVAIECLGSDFQETVDRLDKMKEQLPKSSDGADDSGFGFAPTKAHSNKEK
jgi:SpoVK/Ycf46/Vps4 family AAA+-type ATPase